MHRTLRSSLSVLVLAALAYSCTSSNAPSPDGRDHVRVVALPFLSLMPFHIAAAEGYFDEQGLDVEFMMLGRNQDVMATLAQGDVDAMAGMLTLNELSLAASGARVRVVAALTGPPPPTDACAQVAVMIRGEHVASGASADPERIRRMRFDVNPFIPLGYATDLFLGSMGLSLDDIETVDLTPVVALEAMRTGQIDVTTDSEPYLTMYAENGAVVWKSVYDLVPGYLHSVVMFGPTLLDERPEVGERFTTAVLKAIRQYRLGKTPENLAIVEEATGLTTDQVTTACWPTPTEEARVDPEAFRGYQEWSVRRGLLDRVLTGPELVDSRFIDSANATLAKQGGLSGPR